MFIGDAEIRHGLRKSPDGLQCVHGFETSQITDEETNEVLGVTIKLFGHDPFGKKTLMQFMISPSQTEDVCNSLMGVLLDMPSDYNGGTGNGDYSD